MIDFEKLDLIVHDLHAVILKSDLISGHVWDSENINNNYYSINKNKSFTQLGTTFQKQVLFFYDTMPDSRIRLVKIYIESIKQGDYMIMIPMIYNSVLYASSTEIVLDSKLSTVDIKDIIFSLSTTNNIAELGYCYIIIKLHTLFPKKSLFSFNHQGTIRDSVLKEVLELFRNVGP